MDFEAKRHFRQGKTYWVIKDPAGVHYFRFQEEEYAILVMLDSQMSLGDVKGKFEAQFAPQKITLQELQRFSGMLQRHGLVVASVPPEKGGYNSSRYG